MRHAKMKRQHGVALLTAVLMLMLVSGLAATLIYMTNVETSVNSNYQREQILYTAARAGVEEARDRLMASSASAIIPCNAGCTAATPVLPTSANGGVVYILGGSTPASVTPWTLNTTYTDTELCHDGYTLSGMTPVSGDVRCTTVPTGSAWYTTTTSTAPWAGTSAALPYVWVRVNWKQNNSIDNGAYLVDVTQPASTAGVCYNGTNEVLLNAANCAAMSPPATPVYMVTALAVNPTTGARKMVQTEVALPPPVVTNNVGFFATSTACGAFTFSGGPPKAGPGNTYGINVDSYNSANGPYSATNSSETGGSIGSNGNVDLTGGTQIGGNIYASNVMVGPCPNGLTETGNAGTVSGTTPPNQLLPSPGAVYPTPPAPNPLPPTSNLKNPSTLVPGTYGNLSLTGGTTLVISPGVYNINSISMSGNSVLQISPAGAVVLNVAGTGQNTPIDMSGGSLSNTQGIAANFQINYAGTGNINLSGGSGQYAVVDAPNAAIKFTGGSDFYGSVVGATMNDSGGVALHFDTSLKSVVNSTSTVYSEISSREVSY